MTRRSLPRLQLFPLSGESLGRGGPRVPESTPVQPCAGRALAGALLIGLTLAPNAADAQARAQGTVLMSENEDVRRFQEQTGWSDAVIAGDTIYLSGVVVGQREGESLDQAYDRTYRQISAILGRAGASWADVVDLTSYHTDIAAQFQAMAAVHRRFVDPPFPAWTAIDVDRLVPEPGITEIKIVARRPAPSSQPQRR